MGNYTRLQIYHWVHVHSARQRTLGALLGKREGKSQTQGGQAIGWRVASDWRGSQPMAFQD